MSDRYQVYKCESNGLMIEILAAGTTDCEPTCCGEPMTLLEENTVDAALEKHVPVVERDGDTITVKVGSVAHPMLDNHYIMWIELLQGGCLQRCNLKPGGEPQATFKLCGCCNTEPIVVREFCNLHGLWKAD